MDRRENPDAVGAATGASEIVQAGKLNSSKHNGINRQTQHRRLTFAEAIAASELRGSWIRPADRDFVDHALPDIGRPT